MKNILTNWKTTLIGIIAIGGLGYNAYINGGFSVTDFLALIVGIGFLFSKDGDKSHTKDFMAGGGEIPPDDDEESHPPG